MKYYQKEYKGVRAKIAEFEENRREAHVIFSVTDTESDAEMQFKYLAGAVCRLTDTLGMKPVFKRYLMSDVTNQAQYPDQKQECAYSAIGQPPLDGSKVTLLVIYQENSTFVDCGNGIWKDEAGRIWSGGDPAVLSTGSYKMTEGYLENFARELSRCGGSLLENCLRTWFFVRDVDNNYSGVVESRNKVFNRLGLTSDTHFIASTGIGGESSDPARTVSFNAYADMGLLNGQVRHLSGKSHLNPTSEYGVAFERATAIDYGDRRHVVVSGTASIDNKGNIVAPGDIKAQTERMIENIGVLLSEGGCEWNDVAHAVIYLRDAADYRIADRIWAKRFPQLPRAIVLAPVCRPGWLIETECMAIGKADNRDYEPF
ncbi:MAG: hypothetical protein K2J15_07205 [Muribaculaceae bacterium]|nr:hypothetical protein [Muribaculaceae bacterium]